jgi:hypothetical protein
MATLIFKVSTRPTEIKGGFINKWVLRAWKEAIVA